MAATVLVVEDERKLRELVRSYLERAGSPIIGRRCPRPGVPGQASDAGTRDARRPDAGRQAKAGQRHRPG
jgi:CheY-like chemotaxis protein